MTDTQQSSTRQPRQSILVTQQILQRVAQYQLETVEAVKEDVCGWLAKVFENTPFAQRASGMAASSSAFLEGLCDGVLLCRLCQAIDPDFGLKKFWETADDETFFARDNIAQFLKWLKHLGSTESFETDDLALKRSDKNVAYALLDCARRILALRPDYQGPLPLLVKFENDIRLEEQRLSSKSSPTASPSLTTAPSPPKAQQISPQAILEAALRGEKRMLQEGMYDIGNKRVHIRRVNNHIMVRTGGGWKILEEFILSNFGSDVSVDIAVAETAAVRPGTQRNMFEGTGASSKALKVDSNTISVSMSDMASLPSTPRTRAAVHAMRRERDYQSQAALTAPQHLEDDDLETPAAPINLSNKRSSGSMRSTHAVKPAASPRRINNYATLPGKLNLNNARLEAPGAGDMGNLGNPKRAIASPRAKSPVSPRRPLASPRSQTNSSTTTHAPSSTSASSTTTTTATKSARSRILGNLRLGSRGAASKQAAHQGNRKGSLPEADASKALHAKPAASEELMAKHKSLPRDAHIQRELENARKQLQSDVSQPQNQPQNQTQANVVTPTSNQTIPRGQLCQNFMSDCSRWHHSVQSLLESWHDETDDFARALLELQRAMTNALVIAGSHDTDEPDQPKLPVLVTTHSRNAWSGENMAALAGVDVTSLRDGLEDDDGDQPKKINGSNNPFARNNSRAKVPTEPATPPQDFAPEPSLERSSSTCSSSSGDLADTSFSPLKDSATESDTNPKTYKLNLHQVAVNPAKTSQAEALQSTELEALVADSLADTHKDRDNGSNSSRLDSESDF